MRLIDADALEYTRVRIFHGLNKDGTPCVGGYNAVMMSCAIEDAPTVDAVPVVRCKDCENISPSVTPLKETVWCREFRAYMPCDGFCSYGERKNNGICKED